MRIISKHKDYYDSALFYGHDDNVTYVRHTITRDNTKIPSGLSTAMIHEVSKVLNSQVLRSNVRYWGGYKGKASYFIGITIIGFCGKLRIKYTTRTYNPLEGSAVNYFDTIQDAFTSLKMLDIKEINTAELDRLLELEYTELFLGLKVPCFSMCINYYYLDKVTDCDITLNPSLSKLKLYSQVSPFSAYQEIEMYLGNILHKTEDTIYIEDKYLLAQKGFDKYSFKTRPTKRLK